MNPLVDKKYIFARKLDGKPIEIIMTTTEDRKRYGMTRALFYETGVFRKIEPDDHGRNNELTHELHIMVLRGGKPFINKLEPMRFTYDTLAEHNFLP